MGKQQFKRQNEYRTRPRKNIPVKKTKWLIISEGEKTEPNYFKGLVNFLNENGKNNISVECVGVGKNATAVVNKFENYFEDIYNFTHKNIYENIVIVFDKDDLDTESFNKLVKRAKVLKKGNVINKVFVAWSNESFELWLCLHYISIESALSRNIYNDILTRIFKEKGIFSDGENYEKNGKNRDSLFDDIIDAGGDIKKAVNNAKKLVSNINKNQKDSPGKCNPVTMVYEAVEALAGEAGYKF